MTTILHSEIPFRVRIGVISDSVLPKGARLAEKIRELLETEVFNLFDEDSMKRIRAARHTPVTFSLLSSLSESAERIAAQEILKSPGSKIEVVMPIERDVYLKRLDPTSRLEFEELSSGASRHIFLNSQSHKADVAGNTAWQQMRLEAGRHIVDNCDLLIAICDEKSSGGDSNSDQIIAYAIDRQRPAIKISANDSQAIVVERGRGLNANSISGIERFNTFKISEAEQEEYVSNLYNDLFKAEDSLPDEAKMEARRNLMPFYVRASRLAKRNQKLYRRAGLLIYSFSALSVAAVAVGTLVHNLSPVAFSIELFLLLTILAVVFYANRKRAHRKWIESRFLAERLRSAIFLAVCGVEASPISVPPYMGEPHQSDKWMTMTFNEIWGRLARRSLCANDLCEAFERFARERWIREQIKFHEEKARKSESMNHLLERSGIVVFCLALIAVTLHLILFFSGEGAPESAGREALEKVLTFAAILLPAVGASIGGIRAHREYSRLAKRSRNMAMSLKRLEERFVHVNRPETLSSLLQEAERLMLMETQDWLLLMSFAKLEAAA